MSSASKWRQAARQRTAVQDVRDREPKLPMEWVLLLERKMREHRCTAKELLTERRFAAVRREAKIRLRAGQKVALIGFLDGRE